MLAKDLKKRLAEGALAEYSALYSDIEAQSKRLASAIDAFEELNY